MRTRGKHTGQNGASAKDAAGAQEVSESERLLFGGPLRYDMGWNQHHGSFLELDLRAMLARMPRLIGATIRMAHRADPGALRQVAAAEISGGIARAVSLVAVNGVLAQLLTHGGTAERLRAAIPALTAVAVTALIGAMLKSSPRPAPAGWSRRCSAWRARNTWSGSRG